MARNPRSIYTIRIDTGRDTVGGIELGWAVPPLESGVIIDVYSDGRSAPNVSGIAGACCRSLSLVKTQAWVRPVPTKVLQS